MSIWTDLGISGNTSEEDWQKAQDTNPVYGVDRSAYEVPGATKSQQELELNGRQWGSAQQDVAKSYADVLSGKAPSVAQAQLGAGQDTAMRQIQSAGAAHTGMNAGLSQRNILNAQQNLLGQQNGQQAMLRAGEQDAARAGYGGLASAARQQGAQQVGQSYGMHSDQAQMAMAYEQQLRAQQQRQRDANNQRITGNAQNDAGVTQSFMGALGGVAAAAAGK